jgi:plasmid stabilization system protein ParE
MKRAVVIAPRAQKDLAEIWHYIAEDSKPAADRMIERLRQATELLGDMPGAGHERRDVRSTEIRCQFDLI